MYFKIMIFVVTEMSSRSFGPGNRNRTISSVQPSDDDSTNEQEVHQGSTNLSAQGMFYKFKCLRYFFPTSNNVFTFDTFM